MTTELERVEFGGDPVAVREISEYIRYYSVEHQPGGARESIGRPEIST